LNLFFDSSALAKRYLQEVGTDSVLRLIDEAELVLASRLCWLEVTSAVARVARDGLLRETDEVIQALDDDFATLIGILEVTPIVVADARRLALRHALRAADAVHLATVLVAVLWHGADTFFVCSDQRLLAAAKTEKLQVIDPNG